MMLTTIRVRMEDRDTLNRWCLQKGIKMPELMHEMIEYGVRIRQQAFYASLPAPSSMDVPVRWRKSKNYKRYHDEYKK